MYGRIKATAITIPTVGGAFMQSILSALFLSIMQKYTSPFFLSTDSLQPSVARTRVIVQRASN